MSDRPSRAVLVTGCSSGIGRATALRLAARGLPVYASARRIESVRDLEARGCRVLALDVCDEGSMQRAVAEVEKAEGAVWALVNNAGYGQEGAFEETPMEAVRRQFETNVFGLVRLTQLVLPGMRRQRSGRIVNLSSMGGKLTLPGGAFYHATKHAVEALSDALRFEVAGFGIQVVVVEPGPIRTQFGDTAVASVGGGAGDGSPYAEFHEGLRRGIRGAYEGVMGRLAGEPDAVARAIERALEARRPRTRYVVTGVARALMTFRRWAPDRLFDAVMRTQLPQPH